MMTHTSGMPLVLPPIPGKKASRRCQTFSPDCPDRGGYVLPPLVIEVSNYISKALVGSPGSGKNSFWCWAKGLNWLLGDGEYVVPLSNYVKAKTLEKQTKYVG